MCSEWRVESIPALWQHDQLMKWETGDWGNATPTTSSPPAASVEPGSGINLTFANYYCRGSVKIRMIGVRFVVMCGKGVCSGCSTAMSRVT